MPGANDRSDRFQHRPFECSCGELACTYPECDTGRKRALERPKYERVPGDVIHAALVTAQPVPLSAPQAGPGALKSTAPRAEDAVTIAASRPYARREENGWATVACPNCGGTGRLKGRRGSVFSSDRRRAARCSECFGRGTIEVRSENCR